MISSPCELKCRNFSSSHFTKLVITDAHNNKIHQGEEATLGHVKRKSIKTVINKCTICKRYQGRIMTSPSSPDLPDFRLNFETRAFSSVGIHFGGPIFYRNFSDCKSCNKQTFESFIRAFKRYAARMGTPLLIISDLSNNNQTTTITE